MNEQEKLNEWFESRDCIIQLDKIIPIKDAYEEFVKKYNLDTDFFSKQKLIKLLQEYCKANNLQFRAGRKSQYRFFKIKND